MDTKIQEIRQEVGKNKSRFVILKQRIESLESENEKIKIEIKTMSEKLSNALLKHAEAVAGLRGDIRRQDQRFENEQNTDTNRIILFCAIIQVVGLFANSLMAG